MLGCIPQSPSPEPVASSNGDTGDKDARIRDLEVSKQSLFYSVKLTSLKARLALLERNVNIKPEATGSIPGLKREHEDVDSPRKRPRGSGRIETVDLTAD